MCTDLLHEISAAPEITGAGGGNSTVEARPLHSPGAPLAHACAVQAVLKAFADRSVGQMEHADHAQKMMRAASSTQLKARASSKAVLGFPSATGAR